MSNQDIEQGAAVPLDILPADVVSPGGPNTYGTSRPRHQQVSHGHGNVVRLENVIHRPIPARKTPHER